MNTIIDVIFNIEPLQLTGGKQVEERRGVLLHAAVKPSINIITNTAG